MNADQHIAPAKKEHTTCCPMPIVIADLVRDWEIQLIALI